MLALLPLAAVAQGLLSDSVLPGPASALGSLGTTRSLPRTEAFHAAI